MVELAIWLLATGFVGFVGFMVVCLPVLAIGVGIATMIDKCIIALKGN